MLHEERWVEGESIGGLRHAYRSACVCDFFDNGTALERALGWPCPFSVETGGHILSASFKSPLKALSRLHYRISSQFSSRC